MSVTEKEKTVCMSWMILSLSLVVNGFLWI